MATATSAPQFVKTATAIGSYYTSKATRPALKSYLRSLNLTGTKWASLGGDQDNSFEQAFSSLAYTYLKDKAPRLLDSIVGFQLVDRNEDNTKAVGLFGIKLGDQWLYAPTFFLNGELKGHELLYVKKMDTFVPLKENWVNYLQSRKPHILGKGSPQDAYQMGGYGPDISRLSMLPGMGKTSCDAWARPFLPFLATIALKSDKIFEKHADVARQLDLREFISQDVTLAGFALKTAQTYPAIKRAFDRFYGPTFLADAGQRLLLKQGNILPPPPVVKKARVKFPNSLIPETEKEAVESKKKLKVYDDVALTKNLPELNDDDKEQLQRHGKLIKDERDPHAYSMVYDTQVRQVLTNPTETGIFEVLERPTEFSRMLVVMHPYSNNGHLPHVTAVRLEDGNKAWINSNSTKIWTRAASPHMEFRDWWEDLPESESLSTGSTYMAVGVRGDGTTPFTVREDYGDGSYKVDFDDLVAWDPRGKSLLGHNVGPLDTSPCYSSYGAILRVNARKGTKLKAMNGELFVPDSFRFMKVKEPTKPKKEAGGLLMMMGCGCDECDGPPGSSSEPRPITPGTIDDIQMMFTEKTASMEIYGDHSTITINTRHRGYERHGLWDAKVCLMRDHGLSEKTADDVIASAQKKRRATFRIKYSDEYNGSLQGGPTAPAFPAPQTGTEFNGPKAVNAIYPQEQALPVDSLSSARTDPSTYDPWRNFELSHGTAETAQQAGEEGQKEVFDASMISGMLKSVRQDTIVDRYLPVLMKALDKLARVLFMFYWHQEEFAERYGKAQLPELEDSIRNAFESLGDLILYLKQKSVGDDMGMQQGEPDIDETARN